MNPNTYAEKARSTALYPESHKFVYPVLGLPDEIGELLDKITQSDKFNREDVSKEIGDVLWYIVNVAEDAQIGLSTLISTMVDEGMRVNSFTELGALMNENEDIRPLTILLPVYAGRIAGIAKKTIRDSSGVLIPEKLTIIHENLNNILRGLYSIASAWGINMDDVAKENIEKLASRKERGVLQGSGDNR